MLKRLLNAFQKPQPNSLHGVYSHAGKAEDISLDADRLTTLGISVIGFKDSLPALKCAKIAGDVIVAIRTSIDTTLGRTYAKWFTHSIVHLELDVTHQPPVLRIVHRDAIDQRIGTHIISETWNKVQQEQHETPLLLIANCYKDFVNDADVVDLDDAALYGGAGRGRDGAVGAVRL